MGQSELELTKRRHVRLVGAKHRLPPTRRLKRIARVYIHVPHVKMLTGAGGSLQLQFGYRDTIMNINRFFGRHSTPSQHI